MSKADFVKSIRSPKTPRRFLASLTKYFLSDDPEDKSIFELDLMEAAIKLEQKKPSYGKRKLLNNALVPAIFSLIKREVEASNKEAGWGSSNSWDHQIVGDHWVPLDY